MTTLRQIRDFLNKCADEQLDAQAYSFGDERPGNFLSIDVLKDDLLDDGDYLETRSSLEENGVDPSEMNVAHKKGEVYFWEDKNK